MQPATYGETASKVFLKISVVKRRQHLWNIVGSVFEIMWAIFSKIILKDFIFKEKINSVTGIS